MNQLYSIRLYACLILSITALLASCGKKDEQKQNLIPEVKVVEAASRSLPVYTEFVGETFGQADIAIIARADGPITGIHFKEGQRVEAGQLLYTIDDPQTQNALQIARSQLSAQQVLLAKAKSDYDRVEPLAQINALSKRDLDAARAAYEAQLSVVDAAGANLTNAQVQASYSSIIAPISGVIGISRVAIGDFVSRSSQSLNTISSTGEVRIRFTISENDLLKYQREMAQRKDKSPLKLAVMLSDGTRLPQEAVVDFADRSIDPLTGSLLVQARIDNKDGLLRPGQYVKVRAASAQLDNAVLVPQQAVRQLQTLYQVLVVGKDNMLKPRPVKPGIRIGSNWVISEGLKAGEKVAMVGNAIIQPGKPVIPVAMPWSYDSTLVY
ncbi:MAG: efflux RND transporter periplasmic adaptor subunit [Sphingobacteriales bacterium]|nr:efflux RND transporter periplasmic adaptor subunit [Sphingobacteriales bacterium]